MSVLTAASIEAPSSPTTSGGLLCLPTQISEMYFDALCCMQCYHPELQVGKNAPNDRRKSKGRRRKEISGRTSFLVGRRTLELMESECFFGTRNIHADAMMLNGCIYIYILYNVLWFCMILWYYWIHLNILMLFDKLWCCLILYDPVWAFHTEGWEVKYTTALNIIESKA